VLVAASPPEAPQGSGADEPLQQGLAGVVGWVAHSAAQIPTEEAEEEPHAHEEALSVTTEDEVLKEQIVKVHEGLEMLHQEMAERKEAIRSAADDVHRAALYAELDGLRKEHNLLEQLLHDLVDEATATEWTTIDEALKRARAVERAQEGAYQREEVIRDRQN